MTQALQRPYLSPEADRVLAIHMALKIEASQDGRSPSPKERQSRPSPVCSEHYFGGGIFVPK